MFMFFLYFKQDGRFKLISQRTIVPFFSLLSPSGPSSSSDRAKGGVPSFPSHRPVMLNFGDLTRTGVFHHGYGRWLILKSMI